MIFGTYAQDEEYLWKKFQAPQFDPSTGIDQDTAAKEIMRFAELAAPVPIIKARAFEFLADNLQIEVDPHDFFPAFACWKRRPCPMSPLLAEFRSRIPLQQAELWGLLNQSGASNIWIDFDHSVPEWDEVIRLGFPGLLRNAREWRERHRVSGTLDDAKEAYFEGIRITYEAMLRMLKRFIERAQVHNHERCDFVAASLQRLYDGPPQNFFDALQTIYLYFMFSEHMDHLQMRSLGNLDWLLTPFYDRDLQDGTFTDAQMREMFDHFFMQWGSIDNYWGQPVYLGGTRADGSTQINHLTYFILDEAAKLHLPTPKIQIKIAANTPDEFIDKVTALIRDQHQSIVLVGEEGIRHIMTSHGFTEEDARTCLIRGCYEFGSRGRVHTNTTGVGHLNMLKPFELIFNHGIDKQTGQPVGVPVPPLNELDSFDEFYRLYIQELYWIIEANIKVVNDFEAHLASINPSNVFSPTIPNSLRTGRDAFHNGCDHNNSSLLTTGFGSAIDALSIIEELVYRKGEIPLEKMAAALNANWEGHEELHRKILSFRKRYGNGIPEVDRFAQMLSRTLGNCINGRPNSRGGVWKSAAHCAKQFIEQGKKTGATPDGRFAGEEMSKNTSPAMGADINGVTALLRSALAIDAASFPGDFPLDVMMHPSSVQGADGLAAWRQLLRVYFAGNGVAIHFNIFDAEELKRAQKHPEKYKGLQVRVCGWNVRFTEMAKSEQDMYIRRAENIIG
jgi:pyruvate-formate lyase